MFIQQLSASTEMYLKAIVEMSDRDVVAVSRLAAWANRDWLSIRPTRV
jgi:hypothetical protein